MRKKAIPHVTILFTTANVRNKKGRQSETVALKCFISRVDLSELEAHRPCDGMAVQIHFYRI